MGKDKKKIDKYGQVDRLVYDIKTSLRNEVIQNMKDNLHNASDHYYEDLASKIMSILDQCNTSKKEVEELILQLDIYINQ